uniref:Uncharacterized protein n=1 Tax=Chromera velia CCMP2878 TaxID=1169474 RepID=A0A0G4FQH0_9ALVE|eukprot:Cvel_442.t1-p1 / transcript=Cvel_442.t1 / gene=Cvel_442 / organism=Chromera_velia_CCMP2878 / gene_product=Putative ankyrin repeat protein FPV162, putative / transcript_product=Putative ankyrin repeat protein FPV162, putative / location=Cvel_scaffold14:96845-98395(+) / protein_length=517 / sequence_SO=supercontig / SO=protein_coding / is_pseudo=false
MEDLTASVLFVLGDLARFEDTLTQFVHEVKSKKDVLKSFLPKDLQSAIPSPSPPASPLPDSPSMSRLWELLTDFKKQSRVELNQITNRHYKFDFEKLIDANLQNLTLPFQPISTQTFFTSLKTSKDLATVLKVGVDVNALQPLSSRWARPRTALMLAVIHNNLYAVRTLLRAGADKEVEVPISEQPPTDGPEPTYSAGEGMRALHFACTHGRPEIFRFLVAQGAKVTVTDANNESALHFAAQGSPPDIVEFLLSQGLGVNAKGSKGDTPLLYAACEKDFENAKVLISHGADVNARSTEGETPLLLAASADLLENAKLLVSHGADVNARGTEQETPLLLAASADLLENAKLLVSHGADVNARGTEGETPLLLAASADLLENAKLLVSHGAEVKVMDEWERTILHHAAANWSFEFTEYALEQGISVNALTCDRFNALHMLCLAHDPSARGKEGKKDPVGLKIAQLLVERGVDLHAKDDNGQTARVCAECYLDAWQDCEEDEIVPHEITQFLYEKMGIEY